MATKVRYILIHLFYCCATCVVIVRSQKSADDSYYQRSQGYNLFGIPQPGDSDYRTFVYNNRRYGQYQPNGYGYPGDPNRIGQDPRFRYDQVSKFINLYFHDSQ